VFFFEKKNQKTLVCLAMRRASGVGEWEGRTDKSFLVLLSKKEHFLPLSPAVATMA
jgi:hypothetical protein